MDVWKDIATEGLRRLFDGSQDSIANLYDIISDGKLNGGAAAGNRTDNSYGEVAESFGSTIFVYDLEAIWRFNKAAPVVIDSGHECGNNDTDGLHFKSSVTSESAGACVDGKQYYIVSAGGKGNQFSKLPGLEPFFSDGTRWSAGHLHLEDLITG